MWRTGALAVLALLAIGPGVASADPARTLSSERGGAAARIAYDEGTGRGLAAWFADAPQDGIPAADVVVRALDRRGRPAGPEAVAGTGSGFNPAFTGGEPLAVAADTRRHRFLFAYTAYGPDMATEEIVTPFPGTEGTRSRVADRELFVRLVAADGKPLGAPLRISDTGPPERTDTTAAAPTAAYDPQRDEFVVVYTGVPEPGQGRLYGARIDPFGAEIGQERALALACPPSRPRPPWPGSSPTAAALTC